MWRILNPAWSSGRRFGLSPRGASNQEQAYPPANSGPRERQRQQQPSGVGLARPFRKSGQGQAAGRPIKSRTPSPSATPRTRPPARPSIAPTHGGDTGAKKTSHEPALGNCRPYEPARHGRASRSEFSWPAISKHCGQVSLPALWTPVWRVRRPQQEQVNLKTAVG